MSVLIASGVVVARRNEKREFLNRQTGVIETVDIVNVHLADSKGEGDPVAVQVTKEQIAALEPYKTYSLPVEVNVYLNRKNVPVHNFRCLKDYRIIPVQPNNQPR